MILNSVNRFFWRNIKILGKVYGENYDEVSFIVCSVEMIFVVEKSECG